MKRAIAIAVLSVFIAAPAYAQGASHYTPGQQMQKKGSYKNTTGASGYAPGQEMQRKGSKRGTTGASGYAPGQEMQRKSTSHKDRK